MLEYQRKNRILSTMNNLKNALAGVMKGEVADDEGARRGAARDPSLFERMPKLVVHPKDAADVSAIVKEIARARAAGADVALAARAAGTDMSGGPLTTGVVVSFTKHMNRVLEVGDGY
ncbi:MAG: FAD-binding oxidoreductase, partial [Candidatus Magasanikbacteria bacterium]|nr:FAD-binding oxidoreductase [Candidatus Magasanikbacteria bacterium]